MTKTKGNDAFIQALNGIIAKAMKDHTNNEYEIGVINGVILAKSVLTREKPAFLNTEDYRFKFNKITEAVHKAIN